MKYLNKIKWIVFAITILTLARCNQQSNTASNATDVASENIASSETLTSDLLIRETQFGSVKGYEEDEALIWQGIPEWTAWQQGAEENILFLNADDSVATAKMGKKAFDYTSVLEAIENDSSITAEQKTDLLSEVMNGRWFSYALDKKYHNLSEFDQ